MGIPLLERDQVQERPVMAGTSLYLVSPGDFDLTPAQIREWQEILDKQLEGWPVQLIVLPSRSEVTEVVVTGAAPGRLQYTLDGITDEDDRADAACAE